MLASPTANATATEVPAPISDPAQARALAAKVGDDRTGGVYYGDAGQLVVAVTDEATARAVRAEGGVAEIVKYSTAALTSVHATLDQRIAEADPIPNTSWGVDPSTNQVTVEIFDGVSAADEKRLMDLVAGYGDAVRVEKLTGTIRPTAYESIGGIGIVSKEGGSGCTLGFNVRDSSGQKYFVTAGHCADTTADLWWNRENGNHYLGKRIWFDYGGIDKDYAVMDYRNDEIVAYGAVRAAGTEYEITDSRYPNAGESAKRAGAVSSDLVGEVLSPSETVTYSDGTVLKNMIETSHCALPGDSGGPLWTGTQALGITSATTTPSSASCNSAQSQYRTYFQPVHWVLAHHGLSAF
ncbi:S1 family peptidase [Streptomyces sp. NBC_01373]|uniref:S1 family peptidase n=1 Tax=unclassified Streptomyces TaxID=2593676 RepID=UPI00225B58DE|nr:S1 family peptidase [Streptomyces sp. NBC_01373]MCX4700440.1 S1 family peptidase [Streptomyces sp. NBC_01373]